MLKRLHLQAACCFKAQSGVGSGSVGAEISSGVMTEPEGHTYASLPLVQDDTLARATA
jgi:hypothetical protein